jgi:transcriptional regulator with PAS, ATPase and Fis domain
VENWFEEFDGAITVCDLDGIITYMNRASIVQFAKYGGAGLIGQSLIDCHPEPSKTKLKEMLKVPQTNTYTIGKSGKKKIIHQTPLYKDGVFTGLIEMSFVLPTDMPHFIRD